MEHTVLKLFMEQAKRTPNSVAVIFEDKQLTYKELDEESNKLSHYLNQVGVTAETLVAICIDRSLEMIIGVLAIMKAGGAYVPIDPEYPQERISYMLNDSATKIVISNSRCRTAFAINKNIKIIELDTEADIINQESNQPILLSIDPHQLSYLIYTSGSTGKPKGVMIEHASFYSFIQWCKKEFLNTPFKIVYATTSICFDLSVFEIFYPLTVGKCLRIIQNGLWIPQYLNTDTAILINSVPSVIQFLIREHVPLKNVCAINMAGEPIPAEVSQNLDLDNIEVRNLYGPSEDTTYSTTYRLKTGVPVTIGKAIDDTTVYIVDSENKLCPDGEAGEICLAGAGLARGYWNQPELTAEKFLANPFDIKSGTRIYRTGDMGRVMPDGNIDYLGRLDHQVKIRGYRIELGEIESVILQNKQVKQAVALARQDEQGNKTLVAYVIPDADQLRLYEANFYQSQVESWKEIYESAYNDPEELSKIIENEELNFAGWKSSYTGKSIPADEMREWLQNTIQTILQQQPQQVLEIGCGTGLLYYKLADHITKYTGTDISKTSVNQISEKIKKTEKTYPITNLTVCAAHETSLPNNEKVDTVIINSVIQHFPGEEYLSSVIDKSIIALKGKGQIIIGDVRDLRLLKLFKSRLFLYNSTANVDIKEFIYNIDQELIKEELLCVSPEYFYNLTSLYPEITHIDIHWKQGDYQNELILYRYDVIIYVGITKEFSQPNWLNWNGSDDFDSIKKLIQSSTPLIAIKDAPNPRLWREKLIQKSLNEKAITSTSELLNAIATEDIDTQVINKIIANAKSAGYYCHYLLDEDPLKVNLLMELNPNQNFFISPYQENENAVMRLTTNIPLLPKIYSLIQKDINKLLKEQLPDYMIPAHLILLSNLPVTNNGKVDRQFLMSRGISYKIKQRNYSPPRNPVETALTSIWQHLLEIELVGIDDDFFKLGGHSLLATRVVSATRRELKTDISIRDTFTYPTIRELAHHIESIETTSLIPVITTQHRPLQIPLSFSQERLWFLDELEGSINYHIPIALHFNGNLNIDVLEQSIITIVERHEILRTVIKQDEGQAYQEVNKKDSWKLNIIAGNLYQNDTLALQLFIKKLVDKPFNLASDYMIRADLIVLASKEHLLLITLHHIASDGWSLPILMNELNELYNACLERRAPHLNSLTIQYPDYAIWQREYLKDNLLHQKLSYWKDQLANVPYLEMPTDFPRPALQSKTGKTSRFSIEENLITELKKFSNSQGTTLFMTLLAAFKVILYKYSRQNDICIGTPIANRQHWEIEGLIGFFVNTLALRTNLNGDSSFASLIDDVKRTTLNAYEHQDVPFEKVVEATVKHRDISRSPLFQVLFVFENNISASIKKDFSPGLTVNEDQIENTSIKYDITVYLTEIKGSLECAIEYSTDLYKNTTIANIIANYKQLLSTITTSSQTKIDDLVLLNVSHPKPVVKPFNDLLSNTNRISKSNNGYVAPRNEQEEILAEIWQDLLDIKKISVNDDFFEIGGHSIIAVRLISRIEKKTSVRLPLSSLFEFPTISKIAFLVNNTLHIKSKCLVSIKPNGTKVPLYIVHGGGLTVFIFNDFANKLHPDQPVYGLQGIGIDGSEPPLTNVPEIAKRYISEILEQNPIGPYNLAGYSLGGTIAFEMVKQLKEMGKQVNTLTMFDAYAFTVQPSNKNILKSIYKTTRKFLFRVRYNLVLLIDDYKTVQDKTNNLKNKIFNSFKKINAPKEDVNTAFSGNLYDIYAEAVLSYQLTKYNGTITVFTTKKNIYYYMDDPIFLGWEAWVQHLNHYEIGGNHSTMFQHPNNLKFAKLMQECLDKYEDI